MLFYSCYVCRTEFVHTSTVCTSTSRFVSLEKNAFAPTTQRRAAVQNTTQKRLAALILINMFAIRSSLTGRNIRVAASKISQRPMGSGGHAAKEWTGIDKVVRGYFPEDYQSTYKELDSMYGHTFNGLAPWICLVTSSWRVKSPFNCMSYFSFQNLAAVSVV
jgi:hypothetical protein